MASTVSAVSFDCIAQTTLTALLLPIVPFVVELCILTSDRATAQHIRDLRSSYRGLLRLAGAIPAIGQEGRDNLYKVTHVPAT